MLIVFIFSTFKRVIIVSVQPTAAEILCICNEKKKANNPIRTLAFKQNQNSNKNNCKFHEIVFYLF